ncbi:fibronectin type III domain-containing protein [Patescibacteria group bacterium]|nr:fibronectin type III domain-containing protein [Patescibacteria group bacterium]
MKKNKIPTIIGILLLAAGLGIGVFLVQGRQLFKLGATPETAPKDVRITNIKDSSFSVSWTTDKETSGFVKYGLSQASLAKTAVDELAETGFTHYVNIENLEDNTNYFFKINSGGNDFDNNGALWQVKTGTKLETLSESNIVSGSIQISTGAPARNAIVYVSFGGATPLSGTTSQNGSYVINLSDARTQDLSTYARVNNSNTLLEISAQSGGRGVATAQIYPEAAKPAPTIVLGQVYDFRNLPPSSVSGVPKASLGLPQNTPQKESGFKIPENTETPANEIVTLNSLNEGEIISTTKPEFFGEGPAGTEITITVESDPVSTSLKINSSGDWKWSPPQGLPEGPHSITISWRDEAGILRTLRRNFIVQAAEGPAFVSTPSASTSPTPKAISSPTPTAVPSGSPKAISSPTPTTTPGELPDAGSLTPTYLLSIIGIGTFALAFILWKKSEA